MEAGAVVMAASAAGVIVLSAAYEPYVSSLL
jgi:hypothetical protein